MKAFFKAIWRFFVDLFWTTPETEFPYEDDPENDPPPNPGLRNDSEQDLSSYRNVEVRVTPAPEPPRPVTPPPPPEPPRTNYRIVSFGEWRYLQFNSGMNEWRMIPDGDRADLLKLDIELHIQSAPMTVPLSYPVLYSNSDEELLKFVKLYPYVGFYFEILRELRAEHIAVQKKNSGQQETKYL